MGGGLPEGMRARYPAALNMHRLSTLKRALKPARRRLRAQVLTWAGRREDAIVWLSRCVPGMFRQDEIRLLYRTARDAIGPGDIAEIGSWKGRTAVTMGLALSDGGVHDCRIFAIDHHQGSAEHRERIDREGSSLKAFRDNVRKAGVQDRVEELVMSSVEGARRLADRRIRLRLLFVDGAHDELSVREDLRAFLPLMRPGALIALHDCEPEGGWPGVWKAYQEELAAGVDELARASSLLITQLRS